MANIGILGAGSWGLGLAMLLNNNGHDVTVWSVFPDEIKELDETRENKRCLPGVIFPEHIKFNADTEYVVKNSDVLVLAVASPYTRSTAKIIAPFVKEGQYIVNVYENQFLKLQGAGVIDVVDENINVLTDMSIYDVHKGLIVNIDDGVGVFF